MFGHHLDDQVCTGFILTACEALYHVMTHTCTRAAMVGGGNRRKREENAGQKEDGPKSKKRKQ